jgi:competence protein ComEC
MAVFTPGYRNRFRHPRPEIVDRYDVAGVKSYRTDYDGALTFTFGNGQTHEPRLERDYHARYWREAPLRGDLPSLE